ncbi:zinc finger MYM-type protein 1-like [Homalodisca vitripennis]|uniref:zinc finger MYM-type protein 1-like n=1 Tax=Homalodisca vitripennis TaxID=197043 RepID=UPI001EEA88A6|nr:zinc finger MYM-type protein 1-like [Homalodisca vitripennis]
MGALWFIRYYQAHKKKREEDASKCSSTLSVWLCPTTSTTTTKSTNVTSTSSTETRPIIASVPGNEIEEEVTAQDNAEESIDEEVTCLGLGHQQENCAKPPTSPTSSSELIGVNDQVECSRTNKINETFLNTGEPHFPDQIIDPEVKKRIIELGLGPYQPVGPFPYDGKQGRSFSDNYFTLKSKSGLKLKRTWLCYSSKLDCVYCQPCWLFPQKGPVVGWDSGLRDWKHLSDRIKTHENSQHHADSCLVYEQWRRHGSIDDALEKGLKEERNFWRKVLKRVLDVSLMLATCNLPFRGDSWHITDRNKGNFLSLIELLSKYDTILEDLITRPSGTVNYLSPTIQNEIISLMASEVLSGIKEELLSAPFFSIIYDTTQDVSKVDQLSEVFRYVKIDHDQLGKPCELRICVKRLHAVTDQTASGLEDVIIKSISEKGLDITKCRGQGYDGASVMSVPVTVAKAERSFSKLKLIKNYLRSSMSQQRLTDLAL